MHDLSLNLAKTELAVCGLFEKVLTGPWMIIYIANQT